MARSGSVFRRCLLAASLAGAVSLPAAAMAQAQPFQACAAVVQPLSSLRFDNPEHRAWYLRFWTGSCAGTHSFCMPGSPNWNSTVSSVLKRATPAERASVMVRTCRLGQVIGMEWGRNPKIKRITVADLRMFADILNKSPDVAVALNLISARVAQLMAAGRLASAEALTHSP